MDYVLRLQALEGYHTKFESIFTSDRFSRSMYVYHTGKRGDNPHYHFCLTCDYKQPALRAELKKHFDLAKGNRHLSLKRWDGSPKACSYLFHEGTEPVVLKGFSQDEVNEFREANKDIQDLIKDKTPHRVLVEVYEKFRGTEPSQFQMFSAIMDVCRYNGDWFPNKFQVDRWMMKLQGMLAESKPPQEWESLKILWYRQYYGDWSLPF